MPLPIDTLNHPAWRSLSGNAIKLFLELRSRFNGSNNGSLRLSYDEAVNLLGMSKGTVGRAYKELEQCGFIKKMKEGQWYGRKAHEWAVTDVPCNGYPATRDWRNNLTEPHITDEKNRTSVP